MGSTVLDIMHMLSQTLLYLYDQGCVAIKPGHDNNSNLNPVSETSRQTFVLITLV